MSTATTPLENASVRLEGSPQISGRKKDQGTDGCAYVPYSGALIGISGLIKA
jgi:hypothetical protein